MKKYIKTIIKKSNFQVSTWSSKLKTIIIVLQKRLRVSWHLFFKIELVAVIKEEQISRLHHKIYFGYENVETSKIILLISNIWLERSDCCIIDTRNSWAHFISIVSFKRLDCSPFLDTLLKNHCSCFRNWGNLSKESHKKVNIQITSKY